MQVRVTQGKDVQVFVDHMEHLLWGKDGPNRRLVAIAKEHGIDCRLFTGEEGCFDWSDVFPLRMRLEAASSMSLMHDYCRVTVKTSCPRAVAKELLEIQMRIGHVTKEMATLQLFGAETEIHTSPHVPPGHMDVSQWALNNKVVLNVVVPDGCDLNWDTFTCEHSCLWTDQLSSMQSELSADDQFIHLALSATIGFMNLPMMYASAAYGACLSIPQPAWPCKQVDMALHGASCRDCDGTLCTTTDGNFSPMVFCSGCGAMHHEACMPCGCDASLFTTEFSDAMCENMHGKVSACYGLKCKNGSWNAMMGPWPIADDSDGIWMMHPTTLAHSVQRAARCMGRDMWVPLNRPYTKPTLSDAILANAPNIFNGMTGKRVRQRTASFVGDLLWYGHVITCDRTPDVGEFGSSGHLKQLLIASKGFALNMATRSPLDRYDSLCAAGFITSGIGTTLLQLEVYEYYGFCRTFLVLRQLSRLTDVSLSWYFARWFAGNHPLISDAPADGSKTPVFASTAKHMHCSVAHILSSSKVRRRALPCTQPGTWTVDTVEPVYAKDPCSTLEEIAGHTSNKNEIAEMWSSRASWMPDVPLQSPSLDVGIPCDPYTELSVRFSMNWDLHAFMHREVHEALTLAFSESFADSAFKVFEKNKSATIPPQIDDSIWESFRSLCVEHSEYGWFFYYMATHGDDFDTHYSSAEVENPAELNPRIFPCVQRNVPWAGGWAQPKRLLQCSDAALVDLGHGSARYLSKLADEATRTVAFEIDLCAIREAYTSVVPRGRPDVHFVPVSWVGMGLSEIGDPCIVATAYRPGSVPPKMDHPRMHLLTADCDTAFHWSGFPQLTDTLQFSDATGVKQGGSWRHRVSSAKVAEDAVLAAAIANGDELTPGSIAC